MKYPNLIRVENLIKSAAECRALVNGRWVPARALGFASFRSRLHCAWLVFTGKADAVTWPEDDL